MHAADLLTSRARLTPDREALFDLSTSRRYTYARLNQRACCLANLLHGRLGLEKGDRVCILAHNSVIHLDLLYGLPKIGLIFAPLNWRLTARELAYIINDCRPRLILVGPEFTGLWGELESLVQVEHVLAVEGARVSGAAAYEDLLAASPTLEPPRPPLGGEDPYGLLYTSGTTGSPKGAVIPHRQVLWNCINTVISWGLTEHDVTPVFTPLFHTGGLFAFLAPVLYAGGRVVLARTFDPDDSLRLIETEGCTVILGVPTLFQMWESSPHFAGTDFSRVHFFINGGAAIPPALVERWRLAKGIVFRQGYGLTEVGPNCFSMTDEESVPRTGSVGKPIFHSQMRLQDPETRQAAAPGQPGELLILGPHVCSGYWNNPQATAEALDNGWFHTGDMAVQDEDGFYRIVGRYKDMLKSGGENVYAAEVEAVFRQHPAVAEAALIGLPDEKWGEVGLMIVVLYPGAEASQAELLDHCQGQLARFKIPRRVEVVPALPYSPYGKVLKSELRKQFLGEAQA